MDFGKYIHELLLENDIVIVPGFGAFVSEYKPAEISNDGDEMKPPSKVVSFNQQIRNNDGLLVGHVAENKRISHYDALKRIEKERENILYKLDSGEQVEIDEVGILFYTDENTIAFKAEEDENLLLDSFGLEATTIAVEEETVEEEPEVVPPFIPEDEEIDEPTIQEEIEEEESPEVEETIVEPAPIPVTEPKPEKIKVEEEAQEEKKKRGWLWLFLVLIPLIAVSVFIFMKGNEDGAADKAKETTRSAVIEEPAIVSQDTVEVFAKDTLPAIQKDSVIVEETKVVDTNVPKYYLVGGSFAVEENAETYLNELKARGFDAFHVGKKGRFFIIGIGTYDTFGLAEKAKQEFMTNNPGSEVWVYKK